MALGGEAAESAGGSTAHARAGLDAVAWFLRALWWRPAAGQRAAGRREGFVLPALLQALRPPIAAPGRRRDPMRSLVFHGELRCG